MECLKEVYKRLIEKANGDKNKIEDIKNKIAISFAVNFLTEDEQEELINLINLK